MTRPLHALLVTLVALSGTMPATADAAVPRDRGHVAGRTTTDPAAIQIHNTSGFDVELYVDGALRGRIARGAVETFSTLPGQRQVTVRTRDGWLLHDARMRLDAGRRTQVAVAPPRADVTLINDGDAPLFVTLTGAKDGFWMMPGERRTVTTAAGRAVVTTSIYTPDGLVPVDRHDLVAQPGRATVERIGWTAPPATTTVVVTNRERRAVRIRIAGGESIVIPAGTTREIQVTPGKHRVVVVKNDGGVLYDAPVAFDGRGRTTVEIRDGLRVDTKRRHA